MSTRSCIARSKGVSDFSGVYHHWDGYPSGLGQTLFALYNGHFKKNLNEMLKYLIDDYPAWFSINDADFNLPAVTKGDTSSQICKNCGKPFWMHYAQYYHKNNPLWVAAGEPECPPRVGTTYSVTDHSPEEGDEAHGPVFVMREKVLLTAKNASESGCEYVYVFTSDNKMKILSSYCGNGKKMIGAFGMGDSEAEWKVIGIVDLDGEEPDWDQLDTKAA